jgi:PhzF family phenazine biosynthesis protein
LLKVLKQDIAQVITKAGPIPIAVDSETGDVKAEIPFNFHIHARTVPCVLNEGVSNQVASIVNGMTFIYVELPSLSALSSAKDLGNLNRETYDPSALDEGWKNGLVGTMYFVAQGEDEFGRKKYRTRMFGTREDPGTGSASSGLACLLSEREGGAGTYRYAFEQGVEMGRRNEIAVEVKRGEKETEKVLLSGTAVVVMEGSLEM